MGQELFTGPGLGWRGSLRPREPAYTCALAFKDEYEGQGSGDINSDFIGGHGIWSSSLSQGSGVSRSVGDNEGFSWSPFNLDMTLLHRPSANIRLPKDFI